MIKQAAIQKTLNYIFYQPQTKKEIRSLFHYIPRVKLTPIQERLFHYMITNRNVRPRFRIVKKTGEFMPLETILIPSEHKYYESIIKYRSNFSRAKDALIEHGYILDSGHGFIVNLMVIPLKCKKCMTELKRIADLPPIPIKK